MLNKYRQFKKQPKKMETNKNPRIARAAYMVESSGTFIGIFGSGSAARCRIVTVLANYVAVEVLTVAETKERFKEDNEMGLVREIEDFVFTNMETKAFAQMLKLVDVAPLSGPDAKVIPLRPFDSAA